MIFLLYIEWVYHLQASALGLGNPNRTCCLFYFNVTPSAKTNLVKAKNDIHFPNFEPVCLYHQSISQHRVQHRACQSAAKALLSGLKTKKGKANRSKGKKAGQEGKQADEDKAS